MRIEGAHPFDQAVDVHALGRPALVALGDAGALVLGQVKTVVRRLADEPGLAHPLRLAAQEAQVGLDGGWLQALPAPDLDHGMHVPLTEVARVGQGLEAGAQCQVTEEAAQELGALLPGLVRHGLCACGVLLVVQLQQHLQDLQGVGLAGPVARQHVAIGQARPTPWAE